MKRIFAFFVLSILLVSQTATAGNNSVKSYIIERNIIYPHRGNLGLDNEYPILSYNDYTYIPVKNVAKVLGYEAVWDNYNRSIVLKQPSEDKYIVKSSTMALSIGEATIKEYFSDKVNETTLFSASLSAPASNGFRVYRVSVVFNPSLKFDTKQEEKEYVLVSSDAFVDIDPANGEILEIHYKNDYGKYINLLK